MSNIGSRYGITTGSRENTLYNALWVAQALLRKGYSHFPSFAFDTVY
jgi:ATP-dependent DNA helicase 2 subunit 1